MKFKTKREKKQKKNGRMVYRSIGHFSRPLAYLLQGLFYVLLGAALVALVCIPIVALMRAEPEEMLLPPYLRAQTGGNGNTVYHVYFGDGARMTVPAERVSVDAIKTALYIGLARFCLGCLILAPVCRFIARLLRNLADGRWGDKKNPDMVCFSALTVLVGSPLYSAVSGYFTYLLQKSFAAPGVLLKYVFRLDWYSLGAGILLLLAGFVYGCETSRLSAPAEPTLPENSKT